MRKLYVITLLVVSLGALSASGQTIVSAGSGPWNVPGTWVGGVVPTSSNSTLVSINTTHAITVPSGYTATAVAITIGNANTSSLTINSGGTLDFSGVLTTGTGPSTRGKLNVDGTLVVEQGGTFSAGASSAGRVTVGATGIYQHNYKTTPGAISTATWVTGSTLLISGYNDPAVVTGPTNLAQSFYNVTWNCPAQASDIYLDGSLTTILGNFNIANTDNFILGLTLNTNTTLNIAGSLSTGVGSFLDLTGGSGNTTVNLSGDFNMGDNDGVGNYGSGTAALVFSGSLVQNYNSTSIISSAVDIVVNNSSTVRLAGNNFVSTAGTFTLSPSANLQVGSTDANGAIQTGTSAGNIRVNVADRTYASSSNVTYNGVGAQKLGNAFPTNVNLEINNAAGVTNNNIGTTNVVGNLTLTNGAFNIGNSNTLNIQSNFIVTGGSIGGSTTSNLIFSGSGSIGTLAFAPGTQFLNNLTVGRTADLILSSNLEVEGTISLSFGNLDISGHTLTVNGPAITSGGGTGLKSNATSSLIFGGSTFNGSIPFSGSGNQLAVLTFATPGGVFTLNSAVTVATTLNLSAGAFTNTSGLTMGSGSTFIKGGGTITGAVPAAVTSYNVQYTGTGNTGSELPTSATALNNLDIASTGTINLNVSGITINGNLSFSNGTFNAGSNAFTLKGNLISNASSTLTGSPVTFAGTTTVSGTQAPVFGDITITGALTAAASWQINGNLVNNGTMNAGSGTTTFGGATALSGSSPAAFNNIIIAGTLTAPTGASSFSVAGTFTNNGTFNNSNSTVTFNGTSSVGGSATTNFASIAIASASTLTSPLTLNVARNFTNNGTFVAGSGTVNFNGTAIQQTVSGSSVTNFYNINVTNVVGSVATPSVQIETSQNLLGVLTLGSTSVFDADGSGNTAVFTLVSSADGSEFFTTKTVDASIATIPSGASITGNVTVERYISIEGANNNRIYRYISSAVTAAPVSQIQTYIPVTGSFSGSSACSGCGTNPSMFTYDETAAGDQTVGYVQFPVSSNSEILQPGKGYAIYERGNVAPISTAGSAKYSVTGTVNVANVTPISFPVSFTAQNGVADDGWNLVGNPFPSTIDWNAASGWSKSADISATIYYRDNAAGSSGTSEVYASWNGVVGVNGGSQYIALGQGFYVKSNGGTPSLTATEAVKTAGTQTIYFRGAEPENVLRVAMVQNGVSDETVIHFRADATEQVDPQADSYKLKNSIFNLSSVSQKTNLAINSLPTLTCTRIVKLSVTDATPGKYSLNFSNMSSFASGVKIMLHDAKGSADWIDVTSKNTYEFDVTGDTTSFGSNRFSLSFGYDTQLPTALLLDAPGSCAGTDSKINIGGTAANLTYFARINGTTVTPVLTGNGGSLSLTIAKDLLKTGDNTVEVVSQSPNCASMTFSQNVVVKTDNIYAVTSTTPATSCLAGSVLLKASGAPATGSYNWYASEADATPAFSGAEFTTPSLDKTKTYFVAAVNSFGCEGARVPVIATVVNFDPAAISTVDQSTLKSNYASGNHWFLDDVLLSDTTSTLKIKSSGTYKLVVKVGACSTSDERTLIITGLGETASGITGYPNPVAGIYTVELPDERNEISELPVFNSVGAKIGSMAVTGDGTVKKGQFDFGTHASGFYFVKVAKGNTVTVLKVIKK